MPFKIGEVVQASTSQFQAECYELHGSPPFGSLVKTGDRLIDVYAVVYNAATTSIEPGRHPIARGRDEIAEEDIYRANPQLAKLLRTEFEALVVGHREAGCLRHYLPPQPARIHSFVYVCEPDEVREFSRSFDFLRLLLDARVPASAEELVAACLRQASQAHQDPRTFLVSAAKEVVILLNGQLDSLNAILRRIKA